MKNFTFLNLSTVLNSEEWHVDRCIKSLLSAEVGSGLVGVFIAYLIRTVQIVGCGGPNRSKQHSSAVLLKKAVGLSSNT